MKRKNLSPFAQSLLDDEARDPSGKRVKTSSLDDLMDGTYDKEMVKNIKQ